MNVTGSAAAFRRKHAFTLIELVVSMVVLSLLLVLLEQLTSSTQKTLASTTGKIEQFRDARQAFEAITTRLSQATLNTYWDYHRDSSSGVPDGYVRQSELRFVSGRTDALFDRGADAAATNRPTHAIFFQAPVGMVDDSGMLPVDALPGASASTYSVYHGLDSLLNTWGYCIEYDSDKNTRPTFLDQVSPKPAYRNRFRLVEMQEPTQFFSLYLKQTIFTAQQGSAQTIVPYSGKDWFCDPAAISPYRYPSIGIVGDDRRGAVHVLAENVVALILLPKLSKADQNAPYNTVAYVDGSLSPNYLYDSTSTSNNSPSSPNSATADPVLNPKNQLPPIIQVTMVAVDEASFGRLRLGGGNDDAADLMNTMKDLFRTVGDTVDPTKDGYAKDLLTLQAALQKHHLNYRVFTTAVSLKAAKWSRQQTK